MTIPKWEPGNDGNEATYVWKNYKLVAVPYTGGQVKWDVRQDDRRIARIDQLMEAMNYCALLDERLTTS